MKVTLHEASRLVADWRRENPKRSWQASAKAYAREHGAAGCLRADGSYVLFYMKGQGLHRKTWPQVSLT